MIGEPVVRLGQSARMGLFEGGANRRVQRLTARHEEPVVDRAPDTHVGEGEALAGRLEDAAADQLLQGLRRFLT